MASRDLPWLYSYTVDENAAKDGRHVLRPIVKLRIQGLDDVVVTALVDSGSDHILIAPWISRMLGFSSVSAGDGFVLGVGGSSQRVRAERVTFELLHPADDAVSETWEAEACVVNEWKPWFSVLLGQQGFFDRFTVSFHRGVQAVAIDHGDAFERRHGRQLVADSADPIWLPPS